MAISFDNVEQCKLSFIDKFATIATVHEVLDIKSSYIGKEGIVSNLFKTVASLANDQKKAFGTAVNELKDFIEKSCYKKIEEINLLQIDEKFKKEAIDITIPAPKKNLGKLHPITKVVDEIVNIFKKYGFDLRFDREIETTFYNFDALNFPSLHPARGMHDSFFVSLPNNTQKDQNGNEYMLRTHTSNVQIRSMLGSQPPFCFLSPGRTYRCDMDRTHTPMFNQIEGVLVEKNISFANLKWIMKQFLKEFFEGMDITVRFRPSFFPFTGQSAEVDIGIKSKNGDIKYLEVLGCGVIHPNVLENCKIDSKIWSGFAFGLGIERFAMLKYSIDDLRDFFENKKWWISHYGFNF